VTAADQPGTRRAPGRPRLGGAELERRLRVAEEELARTRDRLTRVETSSAYRLGTILVKGARRPGTAPVTVPRNLIALYQGRRRRRGGPLPGTAVTPQAAAVPAGPPEDVDELLGGALGAGVRPRSRPVLAGILAPMTAGALCGAFDVSPLPPTGGREVLARLRPDLLLVDSSAGATGTWAGLGTMAAPSRDRVLLDLLDQAYGAGVPAVLWDPMGRSRVPFLHDVAEFDLVLAPSPPDGGWDPGVDLAEHAAAPGGPRRHTALAAGDLSGDGSLEPELVSALRACADLGLKVLPDQGLGSLADELHGQGLARVPSSSPWASTSVVVAVPLDGAVTQVAAALAGGARVVARAGSLPASLAEHVEDVATPAGVPAAVTAALEAGPRAPLEHRRLLRTLHLEHSGRVRGHRLLELAGRSAPSPRLDDHAVTVLVGPVPDLGAADALARSLLGQSCPPVAVLVTADRHGAGDRLVRTLRDGGLDARVADVAPGGWWVESARRAPTPWVLATRRPLTRHALVDLVVAAVTTGADLVRFEEGTQNDARPVSRAGLEGALARRDVLLDAPADGDLGQHHCTRGRLVALLPDDAPVDGTPGEATTDDTDHTDGDAA